MKFNLDMDLMEKADNVYRSIETGGIYQGEIVQAKRVVTPSGAEGIEYKFNSSRGDTDFTLFIKKKNGESNDWGKGLISALYVLLDSVPLEPQNGVAEEWDNNIKAFVEKPALLYPCMCGKVTCVFQAEEYINRNGDIRTRVNLKHFLHAQTFQKAKEYRDKQPAEAYKTMQYEDIKVENTMPNLSATPNIMPSEPQAPQTTPPIPNYGNDDDDELLF